MMMRQMTSMKTCWSTTLTSLMCAWRGEIFEGMKCHAHKSDVWEVQIVCDSLCCRVVSWRQVCISARERERWLKVWTQHLKSMQVGSEVGHSFWIEDQPFYIHCAGCMRLVHDSRALAAWALAWVAWAWVAYGFDLLFDLLVQTFGNDNAYAQRWAQWRLRRTYWHILRGFSPKL